MNSPWPFSSGNRLSSIMAGAHSLWLFNVALLAFLANAEGFFLYSSNKKTSTDRVLPPQPFFYRDSQSLQSAFQSPWLPSQPQYSLDSSGSMTTVALPVAVPIQAKMASVPSSLKGMIHNVQLVPCLCPVSRDADVAFTRSDNQQGPSPQGYSQSSSANQPSKSQHVTTST